MEVQHPSPEPVEDSASPSQPIQDGSLHDAVDEEPPGTPTQTSPTATEGGDGENKMPAPLQKRRRVTRACDECRRKKIKCDGKNPCTHCTVYSYDCTYDQPSNRRRNATPQYIETLEARLRLYESIIRSQAPHVDLSDPSLSLDTALSKNPQSRPTSAGVTSLRPNANDASKPSGEGDAHLESMVRSTGQLDLDEEGNWDYHGHSSGLTFMRRVKETLGPNLVNDGQSTPFIKNRPLSGVLESPRSMVDSPLESCPADYLPAKDVAVQLCDIAINDAAILFRVVHMPTFMSQLDAVYETSANNYTDQDHAFLPLLYSVLALGTLFYRDESSVLATNGYEEAIQQGVKYFKAARQLMDIAEIRHLNSVQAVVFMIMFLQSSARLSTCYSYIGAALRSALRMGLHRTFSDSFTPIEAETRKRVFWSIRRMDIFVGALLGLPLTLSDDDIDQEYPVEVDDEYITEDSILPMPEEKISIITACNEHNKLIDILGKIVRYVYPLKGPKPTGLRNSVGSYSVPASRVREIEQDLYNWEKNLPPALKPGSDGPLIIQRVQQLLRMGYAHAQMMLYRPFLAVVTQAAKNKTADQCMYSCAAACVSVSRNVIHIIVEMNRRGLLFGAYWFTMYTTFFAILSLVFYVLQNPGLPEGDDYLRDAQNGKEILAQMARRSHAADRCTVTLATLFKQLPESIRNARKPTATGKKRRQEASPHPLSQTSPYPTPDSMAPRGAGNPPDVYNGNAAPFQQNQQQPQPLSQDAAYQYSSAQGFYDVPTDSPSGNLPVYPIGNGNNGQQQLNGAWQEEANAIDTNVLPLDLSAMMFPSADPFEYPAPPSSFFDLRTGRSTPAGGNAPSSLNQQFIPPSSAFMPNVPNDSAQNADVDVQLLGPLPMYLMQNGQQHVSMAPVASSSSQQQPSQSFDTSGINLDELLGGGDWARAINGDQPGSGMAFLNGGIDDTKYTGSNGHAFMGPG